MGKEVATTGGGLLERYKQGHNPFLDDAGAEEFFGSFLKFNGNNGDFTYGEDYAEELEHGSELLLNMETAMHGYICWVDGEVVDEVNVLISSGKSLPDVDDLEDHGPYAKNDDGTEDGWQEQYVFHFFHEKTEEGFTLKLSSRSGVRAAKNLVRAYGKSFGVKIGDDGDIQVPVVEIGSTSFDVKDRKTGKINKKAGKKHAPLLKIVDWVDKSEVADCFEAAPGDDSGDYEPDEPEDKPARGGRGSSRRDEPEDKPARGARRQRDEEPEEQDDEQDEAPRGRRGSRTEEPEEQDDEPEDKPARGRRGSRTEEPEEQDEAPRGAGRRARVVHAEPQDDEDAPEERQQSARGRRGRSRD